jgi:hypothetical protein
MQSVQDIIQSCGGPEKIEAEARNRGTKLTSWAVKKWLQNGIPEKHWRLVMDMSGATIELIYQANDAFRASSGEAAHA